MLLISGVNILHKWRQHNDLGGGIVIDTTETGYANDDTALEWLHHLIHHTQNKRRGAWLLLIIGGYGSHMIIPFHNVATGNMLNLIFSMFGESRHRMGVSTGKTQHRVRVSKSGRSSYHSCGRVSNLTAL